MLKVKPATKEQLVYYLLHNISLGTYDKRFLTNLQTMQIVNKKPVTSNQSDLLDKIVLRYTKQLRKKEVDAIEMVNLLWDIKPIASLPEYTSAFVTILDDIVEIKSPYKKEFVNEIKSYGLGITWNKETKIWSGPFCEEVLKKIIHCVDKHYDSIYYCDQTKEIINNLVEYETARYWNPTLVKVNGNVLIAGINEPLNEATSSITINDELSTISRLICYGIDVSDELILDLAKKLEDANKSQKLLDFAISSSYLTDRNEVVELVDMIDEVKCDYVIITESFGSDFKNLNVLMSLLKEKNIPYKHIQKRSNIETLDISIYELPIAVHAGLWGAVTNLNLAKTVLLGNNNPIEIK